MVPATDLPIKGAAHHSQHAAQATEPTGLASVGLASSFCPSDHDRASGPSLHTYTRRRSSRRCCTSSDRAASAGDPRRLRVRPRPAISATGKPAQYYRQPVVPPHPLTTAAFLIGPRCTARPGFRTAPHDYFFGGRLLPVNNTPKPHLPLALVHLEPRRARANHVNKPSATHTTPPARRPPASYRRPSRSLLRRVLRDRRSDPAAAAPPYVPEHVLHVRGGYHRPSAAPHLRPQVLLNHVRHPPVPGRHRYLRQRRCPNQTFPGRKRKG